MSDEDTSGGSLRNKTDAFLKNFFETGEALVRDLIEENERLRSGVGDSESPDTVRAAASSEKVVEDLENRVTSLERESGDYQQRLQVLEQEHHNLACMYVSGLEFHRSVRIDDVMQTITEILLNFLGVETFTLFLVDEDRQVLFPAARSCGELEACREIDLARGPQSALGGLNRSWRRGDPDYVLGRELMHLPLVSGSRLVGCARLESLLFQKKSFVEADFGLLSLISEHGGVAIETAWVRSHDPNLPMQRRAIEELIGS